MYIKLALDLCTMILILGSTANSDNGLYHRYIKEASQGNLTGIAEEILNPGQNLAEKEQQLVDSFKTRFGPNGEIDSAQTEWPLVNDIVDTYREYWTDVFFHDYSERELEDKITSRVKSVLSRHGINIPDSANALETVAGEFEKLGVQCLTGRTLPHFDLLAWAGNDPIDYNVDLTDDTVDVRIYFMSDFVSYGWSHYATFGASYPGGWANSDGLFCMKADYDTTSEKFNISYLKHEGRHYADYEHFPKLAQADLEYRAKLTELIYANESLISLINKFVSGANRNPHSPHALANDEVIRNLSKAVFAEDFVDDVERWKNIEPRSIHDEATRLLEESTQNLIKAGADTTTGLIVP